MEYVILDLEWNQPVSKNSYPYLSIGDRMANEIIQLGAYKVTQKRGITDSFHTYIKPKYYKKLNSAVKRITNINKEDVRAGMDFVDAAEAFRDWCPPEAVIFTWGSDDIYVMKQNLEFYNIDTSFIGKWYDLQVIFSLAYLGERMQKSLSFVMERFGIEEETDKQLHDALDDAYYTAQIFMHHKDIDVCLSKYPLTSSFELLCAELSDTAYGGFCSKDTAMANKDVSSVLCPECGGGMEKYKEWIPQNGKYVCVASCAEHGEFVSRVKLNKHLDGKFYVSKVTRKESPQVLDAIKKKCSEQKKWKKRSCTAAVHMV